MLPARYDDDDESFILEGLNNSDPYFIVICVV